MPRQKKSADPAELPVEALAAPQKTTSAQAPNTLVSPSKLDILVTLIGRSTGASMPQLMEATGWQAHSVRGAISGSLKRSRGLAITSGIIDGERRYLIVEAG